MAHVNKDWAIAVAEGEVEGYEIIHKFGCNTDVDLAAEEDVWDGGGTYTWIAAAETMNIASSSTADDGDPVGTGARTIKVFGLDADYLEIDEVVTLNGITDVLTTQSFLRVFRMFVVTAGTGEVNAGNITCTGSSSSAMIAQISIGNNQTLMTTYTIPAEKQGLIRNFYGSVNKKTAGGANFILKIRKVDEVFQVKHVDGGHSQGSTRLDVRFDSPLVVSQKSDIVISATATANDTDVSAGAEIILRTLYQDG